MHAVKGFQRVVVEPTLIRSLNDRAQRAAHFTNYGFFVVEDVFSQQDIARTREQISAIIAGTAPNAEKMDIGFEMGSDVSQLRGLERELAVRKIGDNFIHYDAFFSELVSRPALLGPLSHVRPGTIRRFSDMALLKPAGGGREKPWHQDHAYFEIEPLDAIIGCWIALDEATVENGCMQVVPGSHREGLLPHWKPESGAYQWEWQISPEQVEGDHVVAVPMPPGACLFFSSTLKHGTPPDTSSERRRALQVHFIVGDYEWTGGQPEPEFLVVR